MVHSTLHSTQVLSISLLLRCRLSFVVCRLSFVVLVVLVLADFWGFGFLDFLDFGFWIFRFFQFLDFLDSAVSATMSDCGWTRQWAGIPEFRNSNFGGE